MLKNRLPKVVCSILLGVILSSCLAFASLAEEEPLPVLNTKANTVAIFKNGLGFFIRDGKVPLKSGWAVTEYVPNSALGSMWISSLDKGADLEEVIGFKEEIEKEIEAISMEELLKANMGKTVVITIGDRSIEGEIRSVPEDRQLDKEDMLRYDYSSRHMPQHLQPKSATTVIIDTEDGKVALNKNSISKIEFPDLYSGKFLSKEKAKKVKFKVATRKKEVRISLSYLQKGISWLPGYLVNIENPEKARITMKATLINDVENLENVDVFFVVGYPNFIYADILSPMALEESIAQLIAALESGGRRSEDYSRMANIMRQSVSFAREEEAPRLDYGYAAIKGLPGTSEEDLFLYNRKGVSLGKGERAYYHIFSEEVEYMHVYEWNVPNTLAVDSRGYHRSEQEKAEQEQVWHSVKLTNSTAYPWTTAPALTISGWKPLAQDIIDYTPKSSKTNLKLTVATDIKVDRHEYEIDRQREIRLSNRSYDLVTVEGELHIRNHKTKDVTMEIKKDLTGEVIEVSHDGKTEKIAERLKGVNHNSIISWEVPLEAGEEANVIYIYRVYISQ